MVGMDVMPMEVLFAFIDRMDRTDLATAFSFSQTSARIAAAMTTAFWHKLHVVVRLVRFRCSCDDDDYYDDDDDDDITTICTDDCANSFFLFINDRPASVHQLTLLKHKGIKGCTVIFQCKYACAPNGKRPLADHELENIASHTPSVLALFCGDQCVRNLVFEGSIDTAFANILKLHNETLKMLQINGCYPFDQHRPTTLDALLDIRRLESFNFCMRDHPNPREIAEFVRNAAHIDHWTVDRYLTMFVSTAMQRRTEVEALKDIAQTTSWTVDDWFGWWNWDQVVTPLPHIRQLHLARLEQDSDLLTAADMAMISALFPNLQLLHITIDTNSFFFDGSDLSPATVHFLHLLSTTTAVQRYQVHVFFCQHPLFANNTVNAARLTAARAQLLSALLPSPIVSSSPFTTSVPLSNGVQLTWIADNSAANRRHPCRRCDGDDYLYHHLPSI